MSNKNMRAAVHPLEAVHRMHFKDHYYPPIKFMKMQREDIQNERRVRSDMTKLIRQGAYAGITLSLSIAACLFVVGLAAYNVMNKVPVQWAKDGICLIAFVGLAYLCRTLSIKQKKVRNDFWNLQMTEEELHKRTAYGRMMVSVLFLAFVVIGLAAFYTVQFR